MGENGRHPHDPLVDHSRFDPSPHARRAARGDGSLLARFLLWKDEIMPRGDGGLARARALGTVSKDQRTAWAPCAQAIRALMGSPNDPAAYMEACRSLGVVRDRMVAAGVELPSWKDPPEP